MLNFDPKPNVLLEAISYLGRRAAGNTWEQMEKRLKERRIQPGDSFSRMLAVLKTLTRQLDSLKAVTPEVLEAFRNLEGLPHNTIGTGSPAFLLLYGVMEEYNGDIDAFFRRVTGRTAAETAWHMAQALDLEEEWNSSAPGGETLMELVLATSLPDSTKLAILNTYRCRDELQAQILPPLAAVLRALAEASETIDALAEILADKIAAEGCAGYLARTSRLSPAPEICYVLRPFLFGMDMGLTSQLSHHTVQIYCGIGRDELLSMLNTQTPLREDVYDAFKLLGDRTRFDILCYLRDHSAYGQELSTHFGLSRNTIHHHINKLASYGLVRCVTDGNRIYYSLDQEAMRIFLERQKQLFCGEEAVS